MIRRKHPVTLVTVATLVALSSLFAAAGQPAAAAEPTWFDLPATDSFPQGVAAGPDGRTWVANRFASEIERVAPDGSQAPIALESGVDPYEIAMGSDGAMWFTEHNGNRIGRLTAGGDLSEFFLRDRSTPTGITAGPDGALWFAQRGVSAIGRITLDGVITEWPTITPRAAPLGITTGPDGAVWFALTTANAIGRITVDGVMTEIPLPATAHGPQWITLGPDGALWFTARATNRIIRLTVGGVLTQYAVPTPGAGLNGITVGSDGAIWFTESAADAVGRISLTGDITEIPLGEGASPTGIATGPDGAIWFSAPGLNRVGRIAMMGAADGTEPVVTIVSPPDGSVLTEGEGMVADYFCTDEPGGSGVASCAGPVADGAIVPNGLGAHTFTVRGTDGAGNVATATHGYVVFDDIAGPITNQAVFSAGRVIPIILELGGRPRGPVFATGYPLVHAVNCATGERTGPDSAANVQTNLTNKGRLLLRWRTRAGWGGSCRSLVVRLGFNGWSGAEAEFTIRFA
ncbi:MAG TPA: PxKF domain-containing protein [Actinomycetota bacterium]|nr:PxKF domain-containing protein [Actinomycetota bacterium]